MFPVFVMHVDTYTFEMTYANESAIASTRARLGLLPSLETVAHFRGENPAAVRREVMLVAATGRDVIRVVRTRGLGTRLLVIHKLDERTVQFVSFSIQKIAAELEKREPEKETAP